MSHRARAARRAPRAIADVKRTLSRSLLANPNVSGVGIDLDPDGRAQIKIYLSQDVGDAEWLPHEAEGYPVVAEYIGPIEAFDAEPG